MRELFLAAGGGGLGLFTAIRRLKAVYERLGPELARAGLPLYAQHVDPLEVGALVDVFRAERDSCLLGTDAVRDGVDVPGRSLRVLAFDRVPWPRPDLLHKARRERFGTGSGGRSWDDALARGRIAQAFGRLIRRADDRGVFVMLDAACPTRLFAALPPGTEVLRLGLAETVELTRGFLASSSSSSGEAKRRPGDPAAPKAIFAGCAARGFSPSGRRWVPRSAPLRGLPEDDGRKSARLQPASGLRKLLVSSTASARPMRWTSVPGGNPANSRVGQAASSIRKTPLSSARRIRRPNA
ncbi:bifunctional ATP-dependent DNA helicase/DNA polymerase III subunit epsilon [compost metagenome]